MEVICGITGHIVALPYPGRGHINAMMNLCKFLALKTEVNITFVITEEWLGFIGSEQKPYKISFQSIPNVIPSELVRANDIDGFIEAIRTKMETPFEKLMEQLDQPPVNILIADVCIPWGVAVGNRLNIPVASLWPMSASMFSVNHHLQLLNENHDPAVGLSEHVDNILDQVSRICSTGVLDLRKLLFKDEQLMLGELFTSTRKAKCLMLSSCYELETQVIDELRVSFPVPVYPVGPLIPNTTITETPLDVSDYLQWLDSQPRKSILYVSLGSFLSVSNEQMNEIMAGVCLSGVRYFWIARGNTSLVQEACGKMGLVVQWCDQLQVLCHPSIGGLWTHCGWNSTMEGVFAGVPMLTFPIAFDQVPNEKQIVDDWKVGLRVKEAGKESIIKSKEIATIVSEFMDLDGSENIERRRRSCELRDTSICALAKGGSSESSLDEFVRKFLQCC